MKLKLDENLPREVLGRLAAAGHDAETVLGEALGGAADPRVLDACRAEDRALVTLDVDFADIVAYPPEPLPGVIVLRPSRQSRSLILDLVSRVVVPLFEREDIAGRLWIVQPARIRTHP